MLEGSDISSGFCGGTETITKYLYNQENQGKYFECVAVHIFGQAMSSGDNCGH